MKRIAILVLLFLILCSSSIVAKTIKNSIIFLAYDKEKRPVLILIELRRQETSIKEKTYTTVTIKHLIDNKIVPLYNETYISDTPVERFSFSKNFLIKLSGQNQIDIGTSGLSSNFNIITLAQKKRATYRRSVNNANYKYYINTAFSLKNGTTIKGSLLFVEGESHSEEFDMPEIIYMIDNLHRSWFLAKFSRHTQAVLFSNAADLFRTSNRYAESIRSVSIDMEKGLQYNKSILINIIGLKHRLEINSTSDLEELHPQNKKIGRIFIFSEGYAYTKQNMTSIFGIRIINKK